ncbi:tripartite tricarboxylate transporter permease [Psychromarinibacter sp. C21-152]|uniref:Tripartite tricarboxylate transporter permease n=1 Tax=Psychromarinibacter sediminicola TaxID=3033385 RepID=A0AAE3NVG9_9RHOB|nr:tripartite tricarboxylate transporter permease [Psychromarinibacter sediminicola]MDF0601382.1 tripartite tricarboxylate transporter permease [Psychromarinibacter sediminicola]
MLPDPSLITNGLVEAFTLSNLLFILAGVAIGQIVGATPGLSIIMALAIAIPLTFGFDTLTAIAFLISVNKGGTIGGAVPSILINVPGTPESAATALDGHPMAKKGRPLKAMKYALYYSVTGDFLSDVVLILVAAPLAVVALKMGPIEITALMILAFTVISGLVGESLLKGLTAAALGFLCASIGLDPGTATPRFTFGMLELYDGLELTALSIGTLAMSEILYNIVGARKGKPSAAPIRVSGGTRSDRTVTFREYLANRYVALRAFVLGTSIGAIPGLGSTTAGFLSYSVTKQAARDPEAFGTGDPRGIAASETANSAVVGANLIPLLTLGIPGNIAAALLVSAFMIHGVQPGPLLFEEQGNLIYGMFGAMLIANLCNLAVGQVGMRFWAMIVSAPASVVFSGAMLLCFTGSYVIAGGVFGIYVMIGSAVLGYLMRAFGLSIVAFIVAFILTPELEGAIVSSRLITGDDPWAILSHPIALALLALSVVSIIYLGPWRRTPGAQEDPEKT